MPDTRDLLSLVEAAERTAAAGDFTSAERLLRDVASRQEADFGALHPELAHTLNNLGVVCERTGKPDEAERCYRRAYAIAAAALAPDHPFVSTSRQNLREFCEARGLQVDRPGPTAAAAVEPALRPAKAVRPSREAAPRVDARRVAPRQSFRRVAIVALSVGGLALLLLIASRAWLGSGGQPRSAPEAVARSVPERPAGTTEPASSGRTPSPARPRNDRGAADLRSAAGTPRDTSVAPVATTPAERSAIPSAATGKRPASVTSPSPLVADARLCTALSAGWTCEPAGTPVRQGTLFFYTRVKSERNTTVQHRWYAGDRLRQAVDLRIRAGGARGFRTYSRMTVHPTTGDWRVEVRTSDGTVLHEERFRVQ